MFGEIKKTLWDGYLSRMDREILYIFVKILLKKH